MSNSALIRILFSLLVILSFAAVTSAESQQDVVGYWTFNLEPGFNLVTFPVMPDTPTLDAVFGNRLGDVEVSTWDNRINGYRWARFNSETSSWEGNLFILRRGVAYWVNLLDAPGQQSIRVVGHPEVYSRTHETEIATGWRYFGPTSGKTQPLDQFTAVSQGDLLIAWNNDNSRFEIAEAQAGGAWLANTFNSLQPDHGYIIHKQGRVVRRIGEERNSDGVLSNPGDDDQGQDMDPVEQMFDNGVIEMPPYPVIVGNKDGLPVCFQDGRACDGGFIVQVVRETMQMDVEGGFEAVHEVMAEYEVFSGGVEPGKFRIPLTVSAQPEHLNVGDRTMLIVKGPNNSETHSQTFQVIPGERFLTDIGFDSPLATSSDELVIPTAFSLSSPFPNPFNDRFSLEFNLPNTGVVAYSIYDLNGREVRTNQLPLTQGRHRLTITAGDLSAGLYIVEVKAGNSRGLAKIAHLK